MRTVRKSLFVLPLIALMLTQSGCLIAAAAVGTGATVAYVTGDSEAMLDSEPRQVAAAAEKAMNQMDLVVVSRIANELESRTVGLTDGDTKVTVTAKAATVNYSKVTVRVGIFGDEALQQRLLDKINSNLSSGTPAQPKSADNTTSANADQEDPRD